MRQVWQHNGVQPKAMAQEEIIENLYLPVVNEGHDSNSKPYGILWPYSLHLRLFWMNNLVLRYI